MFLPHGMDQMFGRFRSSPNMSLIPSAGEGGGMVARAVFGIPELRAQYMVRAGELYTNVFQPRQVVARIRQIQTNLQTYVGRRGSRSVSGNGERIEEVCENVVERARAIEARLAVPTVPMTFGKDGTVVLRKGWTHHTQNPNGINFDSQAAPGGKTGLRIAAGDDVVVGSWRVTLLLNPGRYRFSANAIQTGENAICVRKSGDQNRKYTTAKNWTLLTHDFEVEDAAQEKILMCEFRGKSGAAWFESDSLILTRLPETDGKTK